MSSRTQVWLEGLGEWSWPGRAGAAAEVLPPSWVPAFPPQPALAVPSPSAPAAPWRPQPVIQRRLGVGVVVSGVAAACAAAALNGPLGLGRLPLTVERLVGARATSPPVRVVQVTRPAIAPSRPVPTLVPLSEGPGASTIMSASYASAALHGRGSFLVYLPTAFASTTLRYPVLYLLPGNDQSADAFLQIGLRETLDELIAAKVIQPLIAVMIQGGPGANNWRNQGRLRYQSYVVEVQELVDRTLPTIADRQARAIAGDSMGGYGAMNIALANPYRFSVVESWLGFFNGLQGELQGDRPVMARLGLHAFVYGGESDVIANPFEDAPFAAALRATGASATSAVYPGAHNLETLQAHLAHMLAFAGRTLHAGSAWRHPSPLPSNSMALQATGGDARRGAPNGGEGSGPHAS